MTEAWQVVRTAADVYETQLVPGLFAAWAPRVVASAAVRPGDRVLDVACGTGVVAREAASRVGPSGRVIGLDLNPGMVAVARRLSPELTWHQADAAALPFADASFDRVLCQFGLMYVPDRVAALREMRRVVRPAGTVAIAVWASLERNPVYLRLSHTFERHLGPRAADLIRAPFVLGDLNEVRRLVRAAGLDPQRVETRTADARFSSVAALVHAQVHGSPVAGLIGDQGDLIVQQLTEDAGETLLPYGAAPGFSFPMEAHIVVARSGTAVTARSQAG